jgi:hypothetical protein
MKNIHLIPTDKPSKLCYDKDDNLLFAPNAGFNIADGKQHIYITSNEEIKQGDWVGYPNLKNWVPVKYLGGDLNGTEKKIILTTDPDLIADGVQAIDDEFLEWFIKNPSCEFVKVEGHIYKGQDETEYKIIIPKEEPKQELDCPYDFTSRCTMGRCDCKPKQEDEEVECNNCGNIMSLKEDKSIYVCYNSECTSCYEEETDENPKQETLEEAAKVWVNNRFTKQICGNESYPDIHASKEGIVESHILFAKWQAERMYSEEDMRNAFDSAREFNSLDGVVDIHIVLPMSEDMSDLQPLHFTFDEWFEQFKKSNE